MSESDAAQLQRRNRELAILNTIAKVLKERYLRHEFGDLHLLFP